MVIEQWGSRKCSRHKKWQKVYDRKTKGWDGNLHVKLLPCLYTWVNILEMKSTYIYTHTGAGHSGLCWSCSCVLTAPPPVLLYLLLLACVLIALVYDSHSLTDFFLYSHLFFFPHTYLLLFFLSLLIHFSTLITFYILILYSAFLPNVTFSNTVTYI